MWYRFAQAKFDPVTGQGALLTPYDLEGLRFDLEGEDPEYRIQAVLDKPEGQELPGALWFAAPGSVATVNLVHVAPQYRGKGLGEALYQELNRVLHAQFPEVEWVEGDVRSQEAFNARLNVFGQPDEINPGMVIDDDHPENEEALTYRGQQPITPALAREYLKPAQKDLSRPNEPLLNKENLIVIHPGPRILREQGKAAPHQLP